jgi:acetoacetyl-CoA synthetase
MSELLWQPPSRVADESNLAEYVRWLKRHKSLSFPDYHGLWEWSTTETEAFWQSMWEYFGIMADGTLSTIVSPDPMPRTKWFEGTRLNYAEHIFRKATDNTPAIIFGAEEQAVHQISWKELRSMTASLQDVFRDHGIGEGDAVAAYLPCIPEATVALLATTSLGAIWTSCSPDFGTRAVIDRFIQLQPKVLIAVDSYRYNGKAFRKTEVIRDLLKEISDIKLVITISDHAIEVAHEKTALTWKDAMARKSVELTFDRVPFSHPLWVLYSSGTTGLPKAITHSHGGILLEQLKYGTFHNDFKPGEHCFWYTTTGWMMWNYIHGALLAGGVMVLYDGSPAYPSLDILWKLCAEAGIHHFGTSAGFILANMKAGITPGQSHNLSALRSIGSTGSTLPPEGFEWIYQQLGKDIWLASMSGGTDVCSAFVGGNPTLPVYSGEIQCRALGCKLEAWNESGEAVMEEEGEMVITKPMPSMPVFFWNDPDFKRYEESYFEMYPGVWRHGDWIRVTEHNGIVIYGRSDATLNRGGIRIGTSEIYRAVDQVEEVKDSLIVCIEKPNGEFWMPLFVVMKKPGALGGDLKTKINTTVRQAYTPRHVPDEIIEVADIPYTISGKKTETPVKKLLMGKALDKVVNPGSLRNPESLAEFRNFIP